MESKPAKTAWIQEQAAQVAAKLPLVGPDAAPEILRASMAERASVAAQVAAMLAFALDAVETLSVAILPVIERATRLPLDARWPFLRAFADGVAMSVRAVRSEVLSVDDRLSAIDAIEATARYELAGLPAAAFGSPAIHELVLHGLQPVAAYLRRSVTAADDDKAAKDDLWNDVLGPLVSEAVGIATRPAPECPCGIVTVGRLVAGDVGELAVMDGGPDGVELFRLTSDGARALQTNGIAAGQLREAVYLMVLAEGLAPPNILSSGLPSRAATKYRRAGVDLFVLSEAGARLLDAGGKRADHMRRDIAAFTKQVQELGRQPGGHEKAQSARPAPVGFESVPGREADRLRMSIPSSAAARPGASHDADLKPQGIDVRPSFLADAFERSSGGAFVEKRLTTPGLTDESDGGAE